MPCYCKLDQLTSRDISIAMIKWCWRIPLGLVVILLSLLLLYALPFVKPVSTLILADWLKGNDVKREWVSLSDISRPLIHSVIAAEDSRFCAHSGVDWPSLQQAAEDALDGERIRGASTISMQTAKNLFLWPEKLYIRKAVEIPIALMLDAVLGKARIMEIYLNIVELNPGLYGVEAASRHYFGKSAKNLSYSEAARLTATLPKPARNPNRLSPAIEEIAQRIEARALSRATNTDCIP